MPEKKIVKQDGKKRVFIYDDGSEKPFTEKKKKFFEKKAEEKIPDENTDEK